MSIFNMVGCGGSSLNYEVVDGTSAPSSPSENTIWINTSTTITSHIFSANEPENPVTGMVWITVGAYSPGAFSATEENPIMIYPLYAKQYVNGAWADKAAQIYQNGTWNSWITYLFKNGDQHTALTGGWCTNYDEGWDNSGSDLSNGQYGGGASITDTLNMNIHTSTSARNGCAAVGTKSKIDLTDYSKIKIVCNAEKKGNANPQMRLAVNASLVSPHDYPTAYEDIPYGNSTVELDVSSISGLYHVIIGGRTVDSGSLYGANITVSQVIIE